MFHSNHRPMPISHRFRDKRRFSSKIAQFSHPCVLKPHERVPVGIWYRHKGQKSFYDGLADCRKRFKIGLVVRTQYRLWQTYTKPPSQPRCCSKYCYACLRRAVKAKLHYAVTTGHDTTRLVGNFPVTSPRTCPRRR